MTSNETSIRVCAFLIIVGFLGCSPHQDSRTTLSELTTSTSVKDIYKVYKEHGISGVSGEVLDCYERAYKSLPSIMRQQQVQRCISMDWAGYSIDSWVSAALKTTKIPFFHEDALNERVRAFLPLSGFTEKEVEDLTFVIDAYLKSEINEMGK